MSYYTSAIETQIVDPQFNQSKYRSEFRITEDGMNELMRTIMQRL
jgi:hypothetical protein